MNKTHWLGVLLDGSAADETVTELLDLSYGQTQGRKRPCKAETET
jgi:predicted DNA-binding protein (MmcQ/YjbR family)